jgi:hypothetical protein
MPSWSKCLAVLNLPLCVSGDAEWVRTFWIVAFRMNMRDAVPRLTPRLPFSWIVSGPLMCTVPLLKAFRPACEFWRTISGAMVFNAAMLSARPNGHVNPL